jgi:hypothetical protein
MHAWRTSKYPKLTPRAFRRTPFTPPSHGGRSGAWGLVSLARPSAASGPFRLDAPLPETPPHDACKQRRGARYSTECALLCDSYRANVGDCWCNLVPSGPLHPQSPRAIYGLGAKAPATGGPGQCLAGRVPACAVCAVTGAGVNECGVCGCNERASLCAAGEAERRWAHRASPRSARKYCRFALGEGQTKKGRGRRGPRRGRPAPPVAGATAVAWRGGAQPRRRGRPSPCQELQPARGGRRGPWTCASQGR